MTLLQHHILAERLTFLTTLALGVFVLCKNSHRPINRIFFFYSLSIAGWSLTESMYVAGESILVARRWQLCEIPFVSFIGTLFLHLTYLLSEKSVSTKKRGVLCAAYLGSFIFSMLGLVAPDSILRGFRTVHYLPYFADPGPFYPLWTLFFFSVTLIGNYELLSTYKQARGESRNRLRFFVWSTVAGYIGGTPDWLLGYGIYVPVLNPFGLYTVPLYAVITAYCILQHRLFDINLVVRKSLVYSLLVTLLTVGYFSLIYGLEKVSQTTFGYQSPWVSLTAFGLVAFIFQPLKIFIQRLVDLAVFRMPQEELAQRMERLEEQAFQAEKFKAVSTLAAGMAHEIKNPLTAIRTFAEFIPEKRGDPEFLDKLHQILTVETERIHGIVQDILSFSKPRPPQPRDIDLDALIASTVNLLSSELLKKRVQWSVDCQHNGATLHADSDQLRQVLINLIQNAADAMPGGGELNIATRAVNSHLELTISDTGSGIPPALLPKIFDPFVTTKPNGNGLGLAVVYSIIQAHRGSIRADSQPGRGTTFTVSLPL